MPVTEVARMVGLSRQAIIQNINNECLAASKDKRGQYMISWPAFLRWRREYYFDEFISLGDSSIRAGRGDDDD